MEQKSMWYEVPDVILESIIEVLKDEIAYMNNAKYTTLAKRDCELLKKSKTVTYEGEKYYRISATVYKPIDKGALAFLYKHSANRHTIYFALDALFTLEACDKVQLNPYKRIVDFIPAGELWKKIGLL